MLLREILAARFLYALKKLSDRWVKFRAATFSYKLAGNQSLAVNLDLASNPFIEYTDTIALSGGSGLA